MVKSQEAGYGFFSYNKNMVISNISNRFLKPQLNLSEMQFTTSNPIHSYADYFSLHSSTIFHKTIDFHLGLITISSLNDDFAKTRHRGNI